MSKELDASQLLAIRAAELAIQICAAVKQNQLLTATDLAERSLLLAELIEGKCLPDLRSQVEAIRQYR